jgi:hypothetical protein
LCSVDAELYNKVTWSKTRRSASNSDTSERVATNGTSSGERIGSLKRPLFPSSEQRFSESSKARRIAVAEQQEGEIASGSKEVMAQLQAHLAKLHVSIAANAKALEARRKNLLVPLWSQLLSLCAQETASTPASASASTSQWVPEHATSSSAGDVSHVASHTKSGSNRSGRDSDRDRDSGGRDRDSGGSVDTNTGDVLQVCQINYQTIPGGARSASAQVYMILKNTGMEPVYHISMGGFCKSVPSGFSCVSPTVDVIFPNQKVAITALVTVPRSAFVDTPSGALTVNLTVKCRMVPFNSAVPAWQKAFQGTKPSAAQWERAHNIIFAVANGLINSR